MLSSWYRNLVPMGVQKCSVSIFDAPGPVANLNCAPQPPSPEPAMHLPTLSRRERGLLSVFLLLLLVALFAPAMTGAEAGVSVFADDRAWHQLPNAMDVLSNLPFLA